MVTEGISQRSSGSPEGNLRYDARAVGELAEFARTRDAKLRERLALHWDGVVHWVARRFAGPNVPMDDLIQVGRIGLLHALDRYDPQHGARFVTYAVTMISGEIKHYFRDLQWEIRVPREMRELYRAIPRVEDELRTELGRAPTMSEMATRMEISEESLAAVMELGSAYRPDSLNTTPAFEDWEGSESLQDRLGGPDPDLEAIVEHAALRGALSRLEDRKRWILHRRYFQEWSQAEVARELGISQMHVSRLEREALGQLRRVLAGGV